MPAMPDFKSIAEMRAMMSHFKKMMPSAATPTDVQEEDRQIPVRDGSQITVRIHRPVKEATEETKGSPLFVMYHGGGYCVGDASGIENECRIFVREFGAVVVNVEYRLAPEFAWPVPVEDAWDALEWVRVS